LIFLLQDSSSRKSSKDSLIDDEKLAIKRAKNSDAARRSRQRKILKMENLEKEVAKLMDENNKLKTRIIVLGIEKKNLQEKKIDSDNRIKILGRQLTEAHQRIMDW